MEFHGIPSFTHGLSAEFHDLSTCANHGIPKFKWVKHGIPCNSKSYVGKAWNSIIAQIMEFQNTYVRKSWNSKIQMRKAWNSMQFQALRR